MPEPAPGVPAPEGQHPLDRLVEVVAQLREHCPWMRELTHASLVEYLVEECYELVDALDDAVAAPTGAAPAEELSGELGDVLLQVVLHAQLQREQGHFDLTHVIDGLTRKMIRRNRHVFTPDGTLRDSIPTSIEAIVDSWHQVKRAEKPQRADPFHGIPRQLPALALAAKTLRRTTLRDNATAPTPPAPQTETELGDLLLDVVHGATANGLDPERALRSAVLRLQERSRPQPPDDDTNGAPPQVSTRLGLIPLLTTQPDEARP